MAGSSSRSRMIESMRKLLQERGYAGTGLNEVIRASGAPKGSLYHHFPQGKEQLAVEAIRAAGNDTYARLVSAIPPGTPPDQALRTTARVLSADLTETDFALGCPVATVALEMSAHSEKLRLVCLEVYDRWQALMRDTLVTAGVAEAVAEGAASFALSTIEGAMLLARVQRSTEPLESAARLLANLTGLLGAGDLTNRGGESI